MPRARRSLPSPLIELGSFTPDDAARHHIGRRRLASDDVVHPYAGVRTIADHDSVAELAAAYSKRMPATQFFSHATAATLWGAPLPYWLQVAARDEERVALHVSAFRPDSRPRLDGVIGHTLSAKRTRVVEHDGLRLTDPATTWTQLSTLMRLDDLVAAGDFFVTGEEPRGEAYPRALATLDDLGSAQRRYGRTPGATVLREALPRVRFGPLSPRETLVRLQLVDAGLPEPELNWHVRDRFGRVVALIDLAYPDQLVGIEYEGDGHRERDRFRADIHRRERLEDLGWTIVRLTADDTSIDRDPRRVREMTNRVARRLRERGWTPA